MQKQKRNKIGTYVCREKGLYTHLSGKGFVPYATDIDMHNQGKKVWLYDNVKELRDAAAEYRACFGARRKKREESDIKKIFTRSLAAYLREKGFKIVGVEANYKMPQYDVYLFENSIGIEAAMQEYKRIKNE